MNTHHRIIIGDCMEGMQTLPDASVHCCITSPPYWGLRDYGVEGQLGLEATPDEFVAKMVEVFREVRRVLRDDGTLWLNLGSSYAGGGGFCADSPSTEHSKSGKYGSTGALVKGRPAPTGFKPKDMVPIPWMVALALQADGWYLRQDIIWAKPNPMPESVTDRCTKAHEYLFLLSKSARYFYDAEAVKEASECDRMRGPAEHPCPDTNGNSGLSRRELQPTRNRRSVWTIPTAPFSEAHFATFPPKLVEPMILAGTSEKGCCAKCGKPWERVVETRFVQEGPTRNRGKVKNGDEMAKSMTMGDGGKVGHNDVRTLGWQPACACGGEPVPCTVLDCFGGSGTVAAVALPLGRNAILCELNPEYAAMAERRIGQAIRPDTYRDESKADDAPLFMEASA